MNKIFFVFLILLSLPLVVSARLVDDTNYAVQPNSQQCFDLNIPEDFGIIDTRVAFTISSNCGDWCDFSKSILTTDRTNPVVIPICLSTKDRKTSERKTFSLDITAQGKQKPYNIGVCVHENQDKDIGKGDPCGVTNIKQDNFDITVNPNPITVEPGQTKTYEIYLYSQDLFTVDIESSTGKKWPGIKTEPKKAGGTVLTDNVGSGKTELVITGKIVNSLGPGDTKTVTVPVYVTDQKPAGDFAIFLSPDNTNVNVNDKISYQLQIDNQGEPKTFNIEIKTPEEFQSDLQNLSKLISGKEIINFQITPTRVSRNSFTVTVSFNEGDETGTKSLQPYISVDEIQADLGRTVGTENQSTKVRKCMNKQNLQNRGKGISSQVDSWGSFLDCTEQPDTDTVIPPVSGGVNPILIVVPIIVIAAALFYYFYKKKKPVEEQEEQYY